MLIAPIPAIQALPTLPPPAASGTTASEGSSFADQLSNAVNNLQGAQNTASADEAQTAAGGGNLADTMVAASQASLDSQVATDLLDKALSSVTAIMNMTF
jgi:flagellar hook-basal body complex protein FliE